MSQFAPKNCEEQVFQTCNYGMPSEYGGDREACIAGETAKCDESQYDSSDSADTTDSSCNTLYGGENGVTNTMAALSVIFAVIAIIIMVQYTSKKGFWWGLGFFVIGSVSGTAIGRLIEPPKCK